MKFGLRKLFPAKAEDAVSRKLKAAGAVKTLKEGKEVAKSLLKDNVVTESKGVKLIPCDTVSAESPTQQKNLFD